MNDNFKDLLEKFDIIKQKGWITSCNKNTGAIGTTFEKELGILENNSFLPDYSDIELKCMEQRSIYPLALFSLSFDGPGPLELRRIVNLYGYPDKVFKNQNILFASLSALKPYLVNDKYYFQLEINHEEEKIYLVVMDINKKILEKISYINFKTIEIRLLTKLKNLALIYGIKYKSFDNIYFKYKDINLYVLQDYKNFIKLLENNDILANIAFRINRSANHYGKPSSKNITFLIYPSKIGELFKKIN